MYKRICAYILLKFNSFILTKCIDKSHPLIEYSLKDGMSISYKFTIKS